MEPLIKLMLDQKNSLSDFHYKEIIDLMIKIKTTQFQPSFPIDMLKSDIVGKAIQEEYSQQKKKGLLMKIISVYIKFKFNTNVRFWLSSCIESVLRGSNPFFQMIVIRGNIIPLIVKDIITINQRNCTHLQTSYDLLGELVKFNKRAFYILESTLSASELEYILDKSIDYIVDSNVFLRSIILSNEYFNFVRALHRLTQPNTQHTFSFPRYR